MRQTMDLSTIKSVGPMCNKSWMNTGKIYQQKSEGDPGYDEREQERIEKANRMRRLIRGADKTNMQNGRTESIVDSSLRNAEKLRNSRIKSKSTSNEIKKLKYNFKDISNQIRRAKSSVNAKQVASKARREVAQLKAKLQTGQYDEEELQAAIEHAKSMERAAKKKARHLEEEEMVRITDESSGKGATVSEVEQEMEYKIEGEIEEYEEELKESIEESVEETMEQMLDLMYEAMEDTMEESLENTMDMMFETTDYEMSEEEFNNFKTKHRNSEDKSMLEADVKYLKALFEIYDRKTGGSEGINLFNNISMAPLDVDNITDLSADIPNVVDISV